MRINDNKTLSAATEAKRNELKTSVEGKEFTLDDAESLLEGIINGRINGSEAKKRCNNIDDDKDPIVKAKVSKNQTKVVNSLALLKYFFEPKEDDKINDEADEKADEEPDNEQKIEIQAFEVPAVIKMPKLEREESAE